MSRLLREASFLGVLILGSLVARGALADHYHVPSGSMRPTLMEGDRVVVDKRAFGLRLPGSHTWLVRSGAPARGDVVVLDSPVDGRVLIKRIVAVPGDEVAVRAGHVYIGGRRAPERHGLSLAAGGGPDLPQTVVPNGRFLVVGDNRGNSSDGRSFGFVDGRTILGKALGIYWRNGPTECSACSWTDP